MIWVGLAAADTTELWAPELDSAGELGRDGLAVSDFDGDGQLDVAVPQMTASGMVVVIRLSADPSVTHQQLLPLDLLGSQWRFGPFEPDAGDELFFSFTDPDDGTYVVMDAQVLTQPVSTWSANTLMEGEGGPNEGRFGQRIETVDLDGDGVPELLFNSPGANAVRVLKYARGTVDSADNVGSWEGQDGINLGWDFTLIPDQDGDGVVDVVAAADGGMWLLSGAQGFSQTQVTSAPTVAMGFDPPVALTAIPDMDGDGLWDVAWVTGDTMSWVSLVNGVLSTWPVSPTGDALGTPDGVWISDGGQAKYYTLETGPQEAFAIGGATMGAALQDAGDLDGDGCHEVYATAPEIGRLYTLSPDCDQQGGPDDTDTGIEVDDTGVPVVPPDDTDVPQDCEPEFGWTCGSTGAPLSLFTWGWLALWWRRR